MTEISLLKENGIFKLTKVTDGTPMVHTLSLMHKNHMMKLLKGF